MPDFGRNASPVELDWETSGLPAGPFTGGFSGTSCGIDHDRSRRVKPEGYRCFFLSARTWTQNRAETVEAQFKRLQEITRTLREPGGCEWDRAQDAESLRIFLLEEAYEVIEAIHRGEPAGIREELGDLMFIVFFYSRLFEEKGQFALEDVIDGVADKLVRRHPHVFGENRTADVKEILKNWERIKAEEKASGPHRKTSPEREAFLPALLRAQKVQEKAARKGFDWERVEEVLPKLREETLEFEEAVQKSEPLSRREEELGDILFTIVNVMRHLKMEPEMALHRSVDKFQDRFQRMQELAPGIFPDRAFADLTLAEKETLWQKSR